MQEKFSFDIGSSAGAFPSPLKPRHLQRKQQQQRLIAIIALSILAIGPAFAYIFISSQFEQGPYIYGSTLACIIYLGLNVLHCAGRLYSIKSHNHCSFSHEVAMAIFFFLFCISVLGLVCFTLWNDETDVISGVPLFGMLLINFTLHLVDVINLIHGKIYEEKLTKDKRTMTDHSINASQRLKQLLVLSTLLHLGSVAPAVLYQINHDYLAHYIPMLTFIYLFSAIALNIFGLIASRQSSPIQHIFIFFVLSLVVAFYGLFTLVLLGRECSTFEIGIHPLSYTLPLFGTGLLAWMAQFWSINKAWSLVKHRRQIKIDLDVRYSINADE